MSDFIERDVVKNSLYTARDKYDEYDSDQRKIIRGYIEADDIVDSVPAADVRPVVKAHWHDVYMTGPCSWAGTCSHCGQANDIPPPRHAHFCPNCGADMSGAQSNDT